MEGLNVDETEDEGMAVDGLNANALGDEESLTVDGLNADVSREGFSSDGLEANEGANVDVLGNVAVAVCPWQLPLLIETSSMAKSLV